MRRGAKIAITAGVVGGLLLVFAVAVIGISVLSMLWWRNQKTANQIANSVTLKYQIITDSTGGPPKEEVVAAVRRRFADRPDILVIPEEFAQTINVYIPRTTAAGPFDPTPIDNLLKPGLLDFRIAVQTSTSDPDGIADMRQSLRDLGPAHTTTPFRWCAIAPASAGNFLTPNFITARKDGVTYLLLYDDSFRTMLQSAPGSAWKIEYASLTATPTGEPSLGFHLDATGSTLFETFTTNNLKHPMAILIDGQVINAPVINSRILGGNCEVTFGAPTPTRTAADIRKEAEALHTLLNSSFYHVRLKRI